MNQQEIIKEEIAKCNQPIGVLSTVNEQGNPESASLYYLCGEDLTFYFITREESRKYKNIQQNPHVAFTITSEHPPKTIQIEGIASVVTEASEQNAYFTQLIKQASDRVTMPPVSQIVEGQVTFMKITPSWIRYGNFEEWSEGDKFTEAQL